MHHTVHAFKQHVCLGELATVKSIDEMDCNNIENFRSSIKHDRHILLAPGRMGYSPTSENSTKYCTSIPSVRKRKYFRENQFLLQVFSAHTELARVETFVEGVDALG